MHRIASYSLFFTFMLMGSGALEYLHNWTHELEDQLSDQAETRAETVSTKLMATARATANTSEIPITLPARSEHHHDETNCEVHAQLHMAIMIYSWAAVLIRLGIWIAFLTLLAVPLIPRLFLGRIDCRGPPRGMPDLSI